MTADELHERIKDMNRRRQQGEYAADGSFTPELTPEAYRAEIEQLDRDPAHPAYGVCPIADVAAANELTVNDLIAFAAQGDLRAYAALKTTMFYQRAEDRGTYRGPSDGFAPEGFGLLVAADLMSLLTNDLASCELITRRGYAKQIVRRADLALRLNGHPMALGGSVVDFGLRAPGGADEAPIAMPGDSDEPTPRTWRHSLKTRDVLIRGLVSMCRGDQTVADIAAGIKAHTGDARSTKYLADRIREILDDKRKEPK